MLPASEETLSAEFLTSLSAIAAQDWDCVADTRYPFLRHQFLLGLETTECTTAGTGWQPCHLVLRAGEQIAAVMPLYLKSHSYGEYVFDWSWSDAWRQSGLDYYPKLLTAIPFTPATGRRFLARPGWEAQGTAALLQGAVRLASGNDLSSLHVTFCTAEEAERGEAAGLLRRVTQQFHWRNRDYPDFDAFLANLSSRKRKVIRRERAVARGFGGELRVLSGDEIEAAHWDAFWRFYQDTGSRKWGRPYLTRAFFEAAHQTLRDDILLIIAERNGRPVAGALNFLGREAIYGRYWGASEDHSCLHFECCYYQAIEAAIARGLARVEAGAQGEHKLARGYLPVETHSLHWIADASFRRAVAQYLSAERRAVGEEIEVLTSYGPFRKTYGGE